jgi:hypothetical protein
MVQNKVRMIAARIMTRLEANRRIAQRHNHDYLEFWRAQHAD